MSLGCFETFTQYDNKFKELVPFGDNKSSCPMFAILAAYGFMENPINVGNVHHEKCVDMGEINYLMCGLEGMITFEQMLTFTNLSMGSITTTSVELVVTGVIGFEHMFKLEFENPYCVIFLKNSKFFVVFVRPDMYCIRDCHESFQYNFATREELIEHMLKVYNFGEQMNIDGFVSDELSMFNNIEFMVIDKPFTMTLDTSSVVSGVNETPYVEFDETEELVKNLDVELVDDLTDNEDDYVPTIDL
jgi:hypothetical protein